MNFIEMVQLQDFFYFPLYVFAGEDNYNQAVLEFRYHVQEEIEKLLVMML